MQTALRCQLSGLLDTAAGTCLEPSGINSQVILWNIIIIKTLVLILRSIILAQLNDNLWQYNLSIVRWGI